MGPMTRCFTVLGSQAYRPSGFVMLVCALMLAVPMVAGSAELAERAPRSYVVQSGDTLWAISGRFLRDPWRWAEVYERNPGIDNPDLIYPGDVLELSTEGGRTRIRRTSGGSSARGDGLRVVKLSPQARSSSLAEAVPTISVSAIEPFLTRPYIADSDQIKRAPYVVGFPDEHIVAGVHDSIYVRKIHSSGSAAYHILRPGDELRDPDSNELLGYEATFVATAALERAGDPAKLKVVRMEREVSIGDRVIPADEEEARVNFHPRPAPNGTRGHIISVLNGVSQIGRYDIIVLDRGTRDQIESGHVFEIYVGGHKAPDDVKRGMAAADWLMEGPLSSEFWLGRDYERTGWRRNEPDPDTSFPIHADWRRNKGEYVKPYERSGVVMVFRTFERVSFGIVLHANRFINVGDAIAPPPT